MAKPTFAQTFPIRASGQDVIGYNPTTDTWGAEINGKVITSPDYDALQNRLNRQRQAAVRTNDRAQSAPGQSEDTPVELHVAAWNKADEGDPAEIQVHRIKTFWDAKTSSLKHVRFTSLNDSWESTGRRWQAVDVEDETGETRPILERQVLRRQLSQDLAKATGRIHQAWLGAKSPATAVLRHEVDHAAGTLQVKTTAPSGSLAYQTLVPEGIPFHPAPVTVKLSEAELVGWTANEQGEFVHQDGQLKVVLQAGRSGRFELQANGGTLVSNEDFLTTLRLGTVTAKLLADAKAAEGRAYWTGQYHQGEDKGLAHLHERLAADRMGYGKSMDLIRALGGALINTKVMHRSAKLKPWLLTVEFEPALTSGDELNKGVRPFSGQVGAALDTVEVPYPLARLRWSQASEHTLYFPAEPTDRALDKALPLREAKRSAAREINALEGRTAPSNPGTPAQRLNAAVDAPAIQKAYDRHMEGNPIKREEAERMVDQLKTWASHIIARHPLLIAFREQIAPVEAEVMEHLKAPSVTPDQPEVKRARSRRPS